MSDHSSTIQSKTDFINFLKYLHQDFCDHPEQWENVTLESYLEALSAYAQDVDTYYKNNHIPIDAALPTWRVFADLLKGASIYE